MRKLLILVILIMVFVAASFIVLLELYLQLWTTINNVATPPRVIAAPVNFTITAYTCGPESTGKTPADPAYCITSSGYKLSDNDSYKVVAVDPEHYAVDTLFYIYGLGVVIAKDTGGDITGKNRLDLFVGETNVESAITFGKREVLAIVYKGKKKR